MGIGRLTFSFFFKYLKYSSLLELIKPISINNVSSSRGSGLNNYSNNNQGQHTCERKKENECMRRHGSETRERVKRGGGGDLIAPAVDREFKAMAIV